LRVCRRDASGFINNRSYFPLSGVVDLRAGGMWYSPPPLKQAVQWKKKKNLLQFANVLYVIGGILAAFAGKVGVLGTVLYFLGFPVVVFVWVWLVVLPFLKRKRAVGGPGAGGVTTVGYKFLPVVLYRFFGT
jgi:hypothetical protein